MPPIMFEDSQPQPKGVRLGDLKERDTYLPHPCSPLSKLAEVLKQAANNCTLVRGVDGGVGGVHDSDAIVFPVSVKMVRADAPGCDATKQIVEDAQALRAENVELKEQIGMLRFDMETFRGERAELVTTRGERDKARSELEHARKAATASDRLVTAFQNDMKAAKADADKLRAEMEKVKAELRDMQQKASKYRFDSEQWTLIAKSQFREVERLKPELTQVTTERDAWKARAEALSKSVICTGPDGHHYRIDRFNLWYSSADVALSSYERSHSIPPAPTTADPERVTEEKKGGGL